MEVRFDKPRYSLCAYFGNRSTILDTLENIGNTISAWDFRIELHRRGTALMDSDTFRNVRKKRVANFRDVLIAPETTVFPKQLWIEIADQKWFSSEDPDVYINIHCFRDGNLRLHSVIYQGQVVEFSITISFSTSIVSLDKFHDLEKLLQCDSEFKCGKSWYGQKFTLVGPGFPPHGEPLSFLPNNLTKVKLKGRIDEWNDSCDRELLHLTSSSN